MEDLKTVTAQKMQSYLKIAVDIESQLYAMQISKMQINNEISRLQNANYYDDADCVVNEFTYNQLTAKDYIKDNHKSAFKNFKAKIFNQGVFKKFFIVFVILFLILVGLGLNITPYVFKILPEFFKNYNIYNIFPFFFAVIGLIIIWIIIELIHKKSEASLLKKEYTSNKRKHNRLREKSEALYVKNQRLIKCYNVQLNAVNRELKEISALRNTFYVENILPEKYRNLVAVSTMYPWLQYGRCTEVYGHGGLFDTFEYDLKLGAIISNLKELNAKMNVVIQNQQILIKEVRRGNEIASQILSHVKDIAATQAHMASDISDIKVSGSISAMANSRTATFAEYQYYRSH